ncbi:hypothetical protein [Geobacter sp. DSM 9736]|uniref:hypothetical protein n=1 Tax=Geobacter sp. DSM 9736 TaxID=1277350 RepID=UPI000B502312|nr:hypothetical protein [Geobacter sp. DSM 9736]SNB46956.1 hypothetical protein SAMN06269301_2430 [Geobacter sp. DSM 9736]
MTTPLHITSGDIAGGSLSKSGLPGEVFIWHDILYEGPRNPGWPDDGTLSARARFLADFTAGGLSREHALETLRAQYSRLREAAAHDIILWFDACLFDQSMLCHILACLKHLGNADASLICVDAFPGIDPFHGLGQLSPDQFASLYNRCEPVTLDQFEFAQRVDRAFALQDQDAFAEFAACADAPLPWVPAAVSRWMKEQPDSATGLGLLQRLALEAVRSGCEAPAEIFKYVSAHDEPPQYWGDITLWGKINALADRGLVRIEGPKERLPQWKGGAELGLFRVSEVEWQLRRC